MARTYRASRAAAAAFVRAGRQTGAVQVLGGGWWRVAGWPRPVQGEVALARELERRGKLRRLGDGRAELLTTSPGPAYQPEAPDTP